MSRADEKEAAVKFLVAELRGEGVKISEKTARKVAEKHFAKPSHKRSRVPRDFQSSVEVPLADTGT